MNRLFCLVTGGHKYSMNKILSTRNHTNNTIVLHNHCVKCKTPISFEIPENFIDMEIERYKTKKWERLSRNGT